MDIKLETLRFHEVSFLEGFLYNRFFTEKVGNL